MKEKTEDLFRRHPDNPILTADDWPYPVNAVFNAGAILHEGQTLLLVRAEDRRGMSHLCVARSADGVTNWRIDPRPTFPADPINHPEELWGVEDPRITWCPVSEAYLIAYTAYSEGGPLVALAKTRDFVTFERLGAALHPDDKDAAVLPGQFDGRWAMIHRPHSASGAGRAEMWISFSPDLKHWGDFRVLLRARNGGWWDANKIGLSPPPMETRAGWLIMYHGVRMTASNAIYRLGLAMLDRNDPTHVLKRTEEWVFAPELPYETTGDVDHVVFPCGWTRVGDEVRLYYGGADKCIALATGSLEAILAALDALPDYVPVSR